MDKAKKNIGNITSEKLGENIIIQSDSTIFSEEFYFSKIFEENAVKRFIKNTEKLIRTSREYSNYIEQLRTTISGLNLDNIQSNISTIDAEMEFHHYPFSLYEVIDIVMTENFVKEKKFTSFSISKEVMELHFKNLIGIVPLTKTNHELAHLGNLFISNKQVFGNYTKFIELYKDGISDELITRIKDIDSLSVKGIPSDIRGLF